MSEQERKLWNSLKQTKNGRKSKPRTMTRAYFLFLEHLYEDPGHTDIEEGCSLCAESEERWKAQEDQEDKLRSNPTQTLPTLSDKEIALMTKDEFLDFRNPGNKFHEADSYDFELSDLNRNYKLRQVAEVSNDYYFWIFKSGNDYLIKFASSRWDSRNVAGPKKLAAIIHQGVLYYSNPLIYHRLPSGYLDRQGSEDIWINFEINQTKRVKYLEEYQTLIYNLRKENLTHYPYLYQRILVQNQPYEIRMTEEPILNRGKRIAILNASGEVVAAADDEWGATLITVASEYRGRGLGKILGQIWYQWNPEYPSGGFTSAGRANAIAIWEDRVKEFLHKGWYSELIKNGKLDRTRLQDILSGVNLKKKQPITPSPKEESEKNIPLIYLEREGGSWGPMFIIYDQNFYQEEDEKYIYGFGFFRDATPVGTFLYTIDYERPFTRLATYLALQMAYNNGEQIYIGSGYGDLLELEGLSNIRIDGDYVSLTQNVLDLNLLHRYESLIRNQHDQYDEKLTQLIEMAHVKWGLNE